VNEEFDLMVEEIMRRNDKLNCSVEKIYAWYNVELFEIDKDYTQDYGDYNYFVEILVGLIETCYQEKIILPFDKLYMNHREILCSSRKEDVDWFFMNMSRGENWEKFTSLVLNGRNTAWLWKKLKN
jgi:hypothetical protein